MSTHNSGLYTKEQERTGAGKASNSPLLEEVGPPGPLHFSQQKTLVHIRSHTMTPIIAFEQQIDTWEPGMTIEDCDTDKVYAVWVE